MATTEIASAAADSDSLDAPHSSVLYGVAIFSLAFVAAEIAFLAGMV